MSEWQTFCLKDLGKIVTGKTPKTSNLDFFNGKYMFITPNDLHGTYRIIKTPRTLSDSGLKSIQNNTIDNTSILVGCIGDVGMVRMCFDKCATNQQINSITDIKDFCNPYYLYYYLSNKKELFKNISLSTVVPIIPKTIFQEIEVLLPNIETQQKIARTLSVLDQKIENNHKINELLHKILELLYEQYFVRFDFLDGNNKPYQTSGGKMKFSRELNRLIPNDFEVKTLGDNPLCNTIKTGVTPFKQKVYYETKHIQETLSLNQGLKVSYNKRPNRANMQPTIYSVWFAKMKDTKKHLFLNQHMQSWIKESILSTGFCGLQCQKHTFEYITSTIKYSPFETRKNNLATGATQKAINIEALDYIFILIPNKELLNNYSKITKPLYEKISNNIIETQTLTALRDFLLPLLLKQQVKPK